MENGAEFGWDYSAEAWILGQGELGDMSRREILDPALARLLSSVEGLKVLDVGCGEGRYSRVLNQRGAHTVGIDPTEAFIAHALALDPSGSYHLCTAENLPFPDASFDIVLSYLSLLDIEDDILAIREMVRVARVGGEIIVVNVSNMASTTATWIRDDDGNKLYRTVDRYMESFHIDLEWKGIKIRNFHRPLSHTIQAFLSLECVVDWFEEPLPGPASSMYSDEHRVPTFQILRFRKQES